MGRAMALAFAEAGANVAIGSLLADRPSSAVGGEVVHTPSRDDLAAVVAEIEARDVQALGHDLDVTSDDSVAAFHDAAVAALGPVDILANAAGITAEHTVCGHPDDLWRKVIDVNLDGTFRTIRRCLPAMIERGWGRVINIASTAAAVGAATSGAYCASKAGVVGLTRCVALEGAAHGVTANAISPTWVDTGFGRGWMAHIAETAEGRTGEAYVADVEAANPQNRLIRPDEIGALALFLCRDEAAGITMQDLTVSAGSLW